MPAKSAKTAAKNNSTPDLETASAGLNDASLATPEGAKAYMAEVSRRAERIVQDSLETLRSQSRVYVDSAGQQLDTAQRYVVDKVKERPVAATMAGVGVGLLLGLLIASGRNGNGRHH